MAKKRYISDSIWTDNWFENQPPGKKLLFIYLISNKLVSICGFYEITIRQISFDTGINQKEIEKHLEDFEKDKKVYFNNGIVCIVNFVKNQNINSVADNLYKGIIREIKELGEEKLTTILNYKGLISTLQGAYKVVPIPYLTLLNFTGLNLTCQGEPEKTFDKGIDIISNEIIPPKNKITFQEKIKLEFDNEFFGNINEKFKLSKEDFKEELEKFIIYWSEKNPSGKKEKWEMEKTFDSKKRFYTRLGNSKKWDKKNDFNSKVAVIHCPDDWYFNG